MFWHKPDLSVACTLTEEGYSIAAIKNNKQVIFSHRQVFSDYALPQLASTLADEVDRWDLLAHDCQLILLPGQYQLILMDALDVPEAEMAKALRWSLKGLSDYDLDDVAVDAFLLPAADAEGKKKAFIAITPLSVLNDKRLLFASACLEITATSIAEMALKNLLTLMRPSQSIEEELPIIVISICGTIRKIHILYHNLFYLIRELTPIESVSETADEPVEMANILFELKRSVDYCVNHLDLPEPKQLLFTPGFHRIVNLFQPIKEKLDLDASLIDLHDYLDIDPPLSLEEQHEVFYSIAGALR